MNNMLVFWIRNHENVIILIIIVGSCIVFQ